ncbi:chemotaxis protein CheX [Oryzomonas sagensis]|uniref:Chemotaxis protein CheX n=1 Tax=Oryzomonas sagensis TaxID=2603857 RepID=A0ABQ6TTX8_9BACT|nr:chemotaxis protein CheX [Oryzomonas sagensis]KAB0672375.1 chemotaxis protein CheX [Oryzomonas sagensis]
MGFSSVLLERLHTTEDVLAKQLVRDVKEVFSTMIGMDDLLHLPLEIDPVNHFSGCTSALVGLAGTYNGLISLHVPDELAHNITTSMLGKEAGGAADDDIQDALGEVANMIAGSFKQHLTNSGLDIRLSTPSVVTGKRYAIALTNKPEAMALRFAASDEDWFMVAVALEQA